MFGRARSSSIIVLVAIYALIRAAVPLIQQFQLLWLVVVAVAGPWIVWDTAKQIFAAAMEGYVLTDVPERRVYRKSEPKLFRNNLVALLVMFPVIAAGAVLLLLDALQSEHLIS